MGWPFGGSNSKRDRESGYATTVGHYRVSTIALGPGFYENAYETFVLDLNDIRPEYGGVFPVEEFRHANFEDAQEYHTEMVNKYSRRK